MAAPSIKTKPPRTAPPRAGRAAANIFARLAQTTRYADPALTARWAQMVGDEIADLGRPGRITGAPGSKTLEIIAKNGAAASAITMRESEILDALTRFFGAGHVTRITLRQGHVAQQAQKPRAGLQPLSNFLKAID